MRFRSLVTQHAARQDKAGTFARRLEREGEALWVFLDVQGVEATNNIAEVRSVDQKPSFQLGGLVLGCKGGHSRQPENSFRVSVQFRPPLVRG
jgi:hypothetical protein